MDAAQVLVIILSIMLAFFLLLSIVLLVYFIKITRSIKRITESAERAAYKFESLATVVQKAVAPAMITKVLSSLLGRFSDKKNKRSRDRDYDEE